MKAEVTAMAAKSTNVTCGIKKRLGESVTVLELGRKRTRVRAPPEEVELLTKQLAALTLKPTAKQYAERARAAMKQKETPNTFTCFGRLPTELRLIIWKAARPEPRIVHIMQDSDSSLLDVHTRTPVPAMLQTCSEARQVARDWYQIAFQRHLFGGWNKGLVYFDFDSDYLFAGCILCCGIRTSASCYDRIELFCQDIRKVQRVLFPVTATYLQPFYDLYTKYPGAKEILLFDPTKLCLDTNSRVSDLEASTDRFRWQQEGKSLLEIYLETEAYLATLKPGAGKSHKGGGLADHLETITAVELAVTPETCQRYGFMANKFETSTFDLSFRPLQM